MTDQHNTDYQNIQIADMSLLENRRTFFDKHNLQKDQPIKNNREASPNKHEILLILWSSIKASLLIGIIFSGFYFLFILFCQFIWLK